MNANTGQPDTTAFLSSYEKTLHSFSLPERLSGKYTLIDCIRHSSEKEIYLLSDSGSKQYLLKKETAGHSSQLRQEYTMLRDMANVKVVDLWQYQEQVDSIILSYYNADYDSVISQLENLVSDLYADEAIMQIAGEDYANYDVIAPEFWNMTEIANIRARLAYRDRILQQKLGSYSAHQHYIINSLGFNLDPTVPNNRSSLYRYATGTADDRAQDYYYALSDILCDTSAAFDTADGFEGPMFVEE